MDVSIIEAISWVLPSAKKGVAAQNVSNLLLVLYAISCIRIKDATFLVAFLLVEFYGNLYVTDNLTDFQYYLGYAFIYSVVLRRLFLVRCKLKTMVGYGILILFELIMCLDAIFFPEIETYAYTNYAGIIAFVHLYIITSFVDWQKLRASLGASINALGAVLGINYNLSFIWYTTKKASQATSKR